MAKEKEPSSQDDRDKQIRDKMVHRVKEWKDDGFDTTPVEDIILKEPDLRKIKRIFNHFKQQVRTLKDLELDLLVLDTKGHEEDVEYIESRLRNLAAIKDIQERMGALKKKIESKGGAQALDPDAGRKALLRKVDEWVAKGYEVKKLKKAIRSEKDITKLETLMASLEKKIGVLEKVKALVKTLETDGFEEDVRRINKMTFKMEKINLIWKEVYTLRAKIKNRQKEVVQAEVTSKPVKIKKKVVKRPKEGKEKEEVQVLQFRRIDLYVQLLQNILLTNKRLLTLDTLRLAQRALKKDNPKVMFFLIQKDFKIKSMMPDHPDSYRALESYLNKLYENMSGLIGADEAKERMRVPAKEYITQHIQEILASGLDDYFPVFLIIDDSDKPDETPEVEVEEGDIFADMVSKIQKWEEEGYKIDRLVQAMEGNRDLALALFRKVEEEIFWLKELEKDVEALEKKGLKKECMGVRKKLSYPERISEIEDDILSLQMMADLGKTDDDDLI